MMPTYEELQERKRQLSVELAAIQHEVSPQMAEALKFRHLEGEEFFKVWDALTAQYPRYAEALAESEAIRKQMRDMLREGDSPRAKFFRLKDKVFAQLTTETKKTLQRTAADSAMDLWAPLHKNMETLQEESENLLAYTICVNQLRAIHQFHFELGEITEPFPEP